MPEVITLYDFLLLPVYLLIFYLIVKRKAKKYEAIGLKKIFIISFWLRMAGAIGYGLLIQYYYGYGDSFGYYQGSDVLAQMFQHDISSLKYLFAPAKDVVAAAKAMGFTDDIPVTMPNDSNITVMKLSAIVSFFTFNKYLLISVVFGFFSFIGIWKLFYVFYHVNLKKNVKLISFFVLFMPSLWFWGSGLLKEPICVGCLGIIIYLLYKNFYEKRFSVKDLIIVAILLGVLSIVKVYITAILVIGLIAGVLYKIISKINSLVFRTLVVVLLIASIITTFITLDVATYIEFFVVDSYSQVQKMQESYQTIQQSDDVSNKGVFSIGDINPSLSGIIANAPIVIGTTLFRPFMWEAKKVIMIFAALEALITLLLTAYILFKTKILGFFKYIFSNSFLLFCFVFSMLFAVVVGYTTFNFGTLIRYKIIFLPFYYFIFIHIYSKKQLNRKV